MDSWPLIVAAIVFAVLINVVAAIRAWRTRKRSPFPDSYSVDYETMLRRQVEQRIADGSLQRDIEADLDRLLGNQPGLPPGRLPAIPVFGRCPTCETALEYSEVERLVICPRCPPQSPLPDSLIYGGH